MTTYAETIVTMPRTMPDALAREGSTLETVRNALRIDIINCLSIVNEGLRRHAPGNAFSVHDDIATENNVPVAFYSIILSTPEGAKTITTIAHNPEATVTDSKTPELSQIFSRLNADSTPEEIFTSVLGQIKEALEEQDLLDALTHETSAPNTDFGFNESFGAFVPNT